MINKKEFYNEGVFYTSFKELKKIEF